MPIMKSRRLALCLGPMIGLALAMPVSPTTAQTASSNQAQPGASGLRTLTGDDARRAEELNKAVEAEAKANRWDESIARAEELLALRTRAQGPTHFETVNAAWVVKALRRVAPMPDLDRVAYRSLASMSEQAESLHDKGKYAEAQPLYERTLEIYRRLLTDNDPQTASAYNNLAGNLKSLGKYALAQPLYEKALEIHRRLLTDDHPDTAITYSSLGMNLSAQGKYAQAQPLLERAVEIFRRLFTDEHPHTATSYTNLAGNLGAQAK